MHESTTSVIDVAGSGSTPVSSSMIQRVTQLLQAQRDMMATQIEVMATNSVPLLKRFSGNDFHTEEGSFGHWLEQFENRAKAAN